ncbi:MAG: DUF2117 domain-containing protein [archaeon]|nr:DUF2117 domain-containing protein [archaeon]MCP8315100.1 DUF2117 domain-containing protein [archaeon]MCP8319389.1 DUF2117 domain-containing protein [archaeon]
MRIGIIFHRPEIIDSNWARKILSILDKFGQVNAKLCGTMGTLAVLDNYMEDKITCDSRPTIECLAEMIKECDSIVIATYSDNALKSHAFCWHLVKKLNNPNIPIIEVEAKNGVVIDWCSKSSLSVGLAQELRFKLISSPDFGETAWIKYGTKYRRILAAEPGDFVLVNGIVVGRAISEKVILKEYEGKITDGEGIEFKDQGLVKISKMGKIDLFKAKIDTTNSIRRNQFKRRYLEPIFKGNLVAFIEHGVTNYSGVNIYEKIKKGITGAVTIGDDTTAIAGDILSRFKIPVIGIVDGDQDGLLKNALLAEDSLVLLVKSDDQLGEKIYDEIFRREMYLNSKFEEVKDKVVRLAIISDQLVKKEENLDLP